MLTKDEMYTIAQMVATIMKGEPEREPVTILNYTPHKVILLDEVEMPLEEYNSVGIIRLDQHMIRDERFALPVYTRGVATTELPEEKEGVFLIVSSMVKDAFPERKDLIKCIELVKNVDGKVIGCKGFMI